MIRRVAWVLYWRGPVALVRSISPDALVRELEELRRSTEVQS